VFCWTFAGDQRLSAAVGRRTGLSSQSSVRAGACSGSLLRDAWARGAAAAGLRRPRRRPAGLPARLAGVRRPRTCWWRRRPLRLEDCRLQRVLAVLRRRLIARVFLARIVGTHARCYRCLDVARVVRTHARTYTYIDKQYISAIYTKR